GHRGRADRELPPRAASRQRSRDDRRERDRQGRRQGTGRHGAGHARGDGARRRPGRRQARAGARAGPPRGVGLRRGVGRPWPPGYHGGVATLTFPIDNALAQELGADRDRLLEAVAERSDTAVAQVRLLLEELTGLVAEGLPVGGQTVDAIVGVLDADGRAVDVLHDVVWRHRGKRIAPKTLNQKRYVDAIRSSTVTFGVGPAGTGKTYLAMALAV